LRIQNVKIKQQSIKLDSTEEDKKRRMVFKYQVVVPSGKTSIIP